MYFSEAECAKALRRVEAPGADSAADGAVAAAAALSRAGKGLYDMSPEATGAGLIEASAACEALAELFEAVGPLAAAAPQLRTGADRLAAGGRVLAEPSEPVKKKTPRRW